MRVKKFIIEYIFFFSFILTALMILVVDFYKIPNPNVILLTGLVYVTFLGGFSSGILSALIIIIYSFYFFSTPQHFGHFTQINLMKVIVIAVFVPVMVLIVGILKRQNVLKTKELELVNEELKRIVRIDVLTNVANRRYFDEVFLTEYNRAIRNNSFLSILVIDIDFFKGYNDYYGHIQGDDTLKLVANIISKQINRPGDFVARYGGEEFVVLLPDTDDKGAVIVANQIIESVYKQKIIHCNSEVCGFVTVSVGVATKNSFEVKNSMDLLDNADKALYIAKQNGRNQVYSFDVDVQKF